jgi:8-oxo-dGTP pyrophosphatase MutT (NUDIX family)
MAQSIKKNQEIINSFGIICYKEIEDINDNKTLELDEDFKIKSPPKSYQIILIQRKHTIGCIEFLRGKYEPSHEDYIIKLFDMMTIEEKTMISSIQQFDKLREIIGIPKKNSIYKSEYEAAAIKFNNLVSSGILSTLISKSTTQWNTPEWGIPKGRRHHLESDLICGLREFYEETGLSSTDIQLQLNMLPMEELYTGINGIIYRHVYYFARYIGDINKSLVIMPENNIQSYEISNIQWTSLEDARMLIRTYHCEKMEIIEKAFKIFDTLHHYSEFIF